ncbi:MAG: hypothetical protein V1777_04570 [Candidatus Micrarchaeota archaeon]
MAADFVSNAVSSLFSLLVGTILYCLPIIAIVLLVSPLHRFFSKRYKQSWLRSALFTTYLVVLVVLIFAYFVPAGIGVRESDLGTVPQALQSGLGEQLFAYGLILIRILALALFFSLLLLPLEFLGVFFFEWFSPKTKNPLVAKIGAVWLTVLVTTVVILFLIPWAIPGLIYLVYWA